MKKLLTLVLALAAVHAVPAQASDTKLTLPIAAAIAENDAQAKLGDSVKFYFGNQPTPKVLERLGVDKTSQKTNSFNKTKEKACNWVFLSDMLALQKRAQQLGANAVINIVSNYSNVEWSSNTEFECHVGAIMAGVAFKGEFVRIEAGK